MKVNVQLFARARDLAGLESCAVELPAGASVGRLRLELVRVFPKLADFLPRCALAVGDEYAGDETVLSESADVAVLPPVSGG